MSILISILLVLAAVCGAGVVLTREPRRQVLAMAVNGFVLTLLFMALQAPDAAFAELAVGSAATPCLFLVAIASMRQRASNDPGQEKPGRKKQ